MKWGASAEFEAAFCSSPERRSFSASVGELFLNNIKLSMGDQSRPIFAKEGPIARLVVFVHIIGRF